MKNCRTCLVEITGKNCLDIGTKIVDEMDVVQAIKELTSVPTSQDDLLPKFICKKCFKLLKSTTDFRRMIIDSYNELTKKLNNDNQEIAANNSAYLECEETLHVNVEKEVVKVEEISHVDHCMTNDIDSEIPININKANESKSKPLKLATTQTCPFCAKTLKGKRKYNLHLKTHNTELPPLEFVCPICPKRYPKKEYLLVHTRSHTGEKPYHCDICDKNFSQFATYYVHKRRLHDKVVQGTCSYCGKVFVDKPELDVHIKMWHTGERPYLCEFCSATFVCNRTLQRHRKEIHSDKKPCQKCGKMLGDYALKKHLIRHQVLEEGLKVVRKKYTCEYCRTVMNFTSRRRHLEKQHGIKLHGRGDDCTKVPIKESGDVIERRSPVDL